MNVRQTVYFMTLVGGLAGLCAWAVQAWLSDFVQFRQEQQWVLVCVYTTLLGGFIGGMSVGFSDKWTADRLVFRWLLTGVLLGLGAGLLSGLLSVPVMSKMIQPDPAGASAFLGRVLAWLITGGLIGFVSGLRWQGVNKFRAVHALIGGMVGGGVGGVVFSLAGTSEVFQALAFVLTGTGITAGVTLAPVLLRDGVLQFISSGDARAQNKYGSPRQEWVFQEGDQFVIGSQGAEAGMTLYARDIQIYVPDAQIAPRHAILYSKARRFFIQQHPENVGPQGQPLAPLQVGNQPVIGVRELHHGDDLIIGQTLLRFYTRQKAAEEMPAPQPGGYR